MTQSPDKWTANDVLSVMFVIAACVALVAGFSLGTPKSSPKLFGFSLAIAALSFWKAKTHRLAMVLALLAFLIVRLAWGVVVSQWQP